MKSILIIAATEGELEGLKSLNLPAGTEFLCTGIGLVNTALNLDRKLRSYKPDWIIQTGICGAWHTGLNIGDVVEIRREVYADLGAESPSGFMDLEQLGFVNFSSPKKVFYNILDNPFPVRTLYPQVQGISVNKVHGLADTISATGKLWSPDTESMEGAAFFQVCLEHNIPFTEIRAVSNYVEVRNREAWNIPLALKNLREAIYAWFESEKRQGL